MRRNIARWALTLLGFALAVGGATAMLRGWDIVQVERGWSQFIAGAAALSGGAIVIALAEVVARLDQLLAASASMADASAKRVFAAQAEPEAPTARVRKGAPPPPPQPEQRAAPPPPPAPEPPAAPTLPLVPSAVPDRAPESRQPAPASASALAPPAPLRLRREEAPAPIIGPKRQAAAQSPQDGEEPREVERYQSGSLTYAMFSDGSVELRSETGAQRFSSIEELRAMLATQE